MLVRVILLLVVGACVSAAGTTTPAPARSPAGPLPAADPFAQLARPFAALPTGALVRLGNHAYHHEEYAHVVSYSADGAYLLTRGRNELRLWDVSTRQLVRDVEVLSPMHVALIDRLAVVGSYVPGVQVVDLTTGRVQQVASSAFPKGVGAIARVGPDRFVASVPGGALARIVDVTTGGVVAELAHEPWESSIREIATSRDGNVIVTASGAGKLRIWRASATGFALARQIDLPRERPHHPSVVSMAIHPANKTIAIAAYARNSMASETSVQVFDLESGDSRWRAAVRATVVAWSEAGLAATSGLGGVMFDDDGRRRATLPAGYSLASSPRGTELAVGSNAGRVRLIDARTGLPRHVVGHQEGIRSVNWRGDGALVATGDQNCGLATWAVDPQVGSGAPQRFIPSVASCTPHRTYAPSGLLWVGFGTDGELRSLSGNAFEQHPDRSPPSAIAAPPTFMDAVGDPLDVGFAALRKGDVALVDQAGKIESVRARGSPARVDWVGQTVAALFGNERSVDSDPRKTTVEWRVAVHDRRTRRTHVIPLPLATGQRVASLALSSNNRIAVAFTDGLVLLLDGERGVQVASLKTAIDDPRVAISPDGLVVAIGATDGSLHLLRDGAVHAVGRAHVDEIRDLAFSPDGRRLLTGSADTTAVVWDIATLR